MLTMKGEKDAWHCVEWPAELKDHVKCRGACLIDGKTCLPPHEAHGDEIGYLGATGKDIEQTVNRVKELIGLLPDGVSANAQALYDLLKEVQTAEEEGIPFTDGKVPKPEEALIG